MIWFIQRISYQHQRIQDFHQGRGVRSSSSSSDEILGMPVMTRNWYPVIWWFHSRWYLRSRDDIRQPTSYEKDECTRKLLLSKELWTKKSIWIDTKQSLLTNSQYSSIMEIESQRHTTQQLDNGVEANGNYQLQPPIIVRMRRRNNSIMRRATCCSPYASEDTTKRILERRLVFKQLVISCENDMVVGSW